MQSYQQESFLKFTKLEEIDRKSDFKMYSGDFKFATQTTVVYDSKNYCEFKKTLHGIKNCL